MKEYLAVIGAIAVFMGGFSYGSLNHYVENIDKCTDFETKQSVWKGYRTIGENNERRCFWLEQSYPHRIRQGIV